MHDKTRGYWGNSPVWWALNDQGYTSYVLGAKRFTYDEAIKTLGNADDLAMYPCDEIDKRLHLVFDMQDFHRLGTDEPCPWKGGYATRTPSPSASVAVGEDEAKWTHIPRIRGRAFRVRIGERAEQLDEQEGIWFAVKLTDELELAAYRARLPHIVKHDLREKGE